MPLLYRSGRPDLPILTIATSVGGISGTTPTSANCLRPDLNLNVLPIKGQTLSDALLRQNVRRRFEQELPFQLRAFCLCCRIDFAVPDAELNSRAAGYLETDNRYGEDWWLRRNHVAGLLSVLATWKNCDQTQKDCRHLALIYPEHRRWSWLVRGRSYLITSIPPCIVDPSGMSETRSP